MLVTKRDNTTEKLSIEKIVRILSWAAEGVEGVEVAEVLFKTKIFLYDKIKTTDIHKTLIKSTADLISEEHPNYQYMAARLAIFNLRKEVFGRYIPPTLLEHVKKGISEGYYDPNLSSYTDEEWNELEKIITHNRDLKFSYTAVKQLEGKYLVQDRTIGKIYETPQFMYMLISATIFIHYKNKYDTSTRLKYIKDFYYLISTHKISLPTPIMAGVRTPTRQYSSCVLIECDDSLDSICATTSAIIKYISKRAGIGLNVGRIRAVNSRIRGGETSHTGCIPFYKLFQSAIKSCSQGGIRGGAATLFYPIWHLEVEDLLVLKNNRGVESNRVRHVDYGVQLSKLFYSRLIKGEYITLFNPNDVPDLYESFFSNQERFEYLYCRYEKEYEQDSSLRKKQVKAVELFSLLMQERSSTGRIYIQNVDHCNTHSPFNPTTSPIKQSNLCMEITLPTKPITSDENEGQIALCTLAAFNLGTLTNLHQLEHTSDILVRALNELLEYQQYPLKEAERHTLDYKPLGIGVVNYAYYLAKNGCKYKDPEAKILTHKLFEAIQYYLLKASMNLAKETYPCMAYRDGRSEYSRGKLPIDSYKKEIDNVCNISLELDWEELRENIKTFGVCNSTLTSLMPSETSSQILNATNGIEPPRGFVSVKTSKDGILKQVVPELDKYRDKYTLLWDMEDNKGYLELVGIMQKFVDQSISANTNYDPSKFVNGKVPMTKLLQDLLYAYKLGIKTLYYHNTRDGATDEQTNEQTNENNSCSDVCTI